MTTVETNLPSFDSCRRWIAEAERGDGWLSECEDVGRFLVVNRELNAALVDVLDSLAAGSVLEVCSGGGELAAALAGAGVAVVPTDVDPPPGSPAQKLPADEALKRHRPKVVLGSFVPFDAGVDEAVLACPTARHYLVLSARIAGLLGSARLWQHPSWTARPLDDVSRWMVTRHDVWIGPHEEKILSKGEAWLLSRTTNSCTLSLHSMKL